LQFKHLVSSDIPFMLMIITYIIYKATTPDCFANPEMAEMEMEMKNERILAG
jgi:hypothetical protein